MKYTPQEKTMSTESMAVIYRVLDKKIRFDILNTLRNEGPMPFNFISDTLQIDRAKLAYHIRILKNANLVYNYYDKMENVKNHSFYKLTDLARWILNNDMRLVSEASRYQPEKAENAEEKEKHGVATTKKSAYHIY
jgi:predicted transcriptional regulator